jgi:ABC-type antimicrobial peptide transport system permease subunit
MAKLRARRYPRSDGGSGVLLLSIAFVLAGDCAMWFDGARANLITGVLGLSGFILFIAGLIVAFRASRLQPF